MTTLLRIRPNARYTKKVEEQRKVQQARLVHYFSICNSAKDIALSRKGSAMGRERRCISRLMMLFGLLQRERKVKCTSIIAFSLARKMYKEWTSADSGL
jgi:hypothetical protein